MTAEIYVLILVGALFALMGAIILHKKHRLIWNKIWEIENYILDMKEENLALRKELCMFSISNARLNLQMPSQHGEDIWLWDYFQKKKHGFFVEVGAYDGITFSNTYFLEAIGWEGILVEPNSYMFNLCCERRPYSTCINAAVTNSTASQISYFLVKGEGGVDALSFTQSSARHLDRVAKSGAKVIEVAVPSLQLSKILENVELPIDFISIDVEGAELDVLRSLDFVKHSPLVFIIEDNSFGQNKSVEEFLLTKGYKSKGRLGANILFERFDNDRLARDALARILSP